MYTKGPWTFDGHGINAQGERIAKVSHGGPHITEDGKPTRNERFEADSQLIAAAPEMLEALEQFISGYEAEGIDESIRDMFSWAYKLSSSAIRKAKGLD